MTPSGRNISIDASYHASKASERPCTTARQGLGKDIWGREEEYVKWDNPERILCSCLNDAFATLPILRLPAIVLFIK